MFRLHTVIAPIIGMLLFLSYGKSSIPQLFSVPNHFTPEALTINTPPMQLSIPDLLAKNQVYHEQLVALRGLITQPELHLDETELYLDFVFRLSQGPHSIVVYGRHDRTQGPPAISMNQSVEVIGTFYKQQERNGTTLFNVLEAFAVIHYPSSIPDNA